MNRRQLFASLGAAAAVSVMPKVAFPETPELTTEQLRERWVDLLKAKEPDHGAIIKDFVARKVAAGYEDLFLFKNRGGQWVFQVYDPASGTPTSDETFFLVYGKPDPSTKAGILPRAGQVRELFGCRVVGVEMDFRSSPAEICANLDKAFRRLIGAQVMAVAWDYPHEPAYCWNEDV